MNNKGRYTESEILYIKENYKKLKDKEIAINLNRSTCSIIDKRLALGLSINSPQWCDKDIELLKLNYPNESWEHLLKLFPHASKSQLITKAYKIGVKRECRFWSDIDINILKYGYKNKLSLKDIEKMLDYKYSLSNISVRAGKLGIRLDDWWNDWEDNYLLNNYDKIPIDTILETLTNRSRIGVINRAQKLNISSIKIWTIKEDNFIRNSYKKLADKQIAKFFPYRTWRSVKWRRSFLGLYKINEGYGKLSISKDGQEFASQEERDVYEYLKYEENFKYLINISAKKTGKYVFDVKNICEKYNKFLPDFALEKVIINDQDIELNKPIIIEYYGMYNENKGKIIQKYSLKTKAKDKFYKSNKDIYYIGIFPKDIKDNFKGLREKIYKFMQELSIEN